MLAHTDMQLRGKGANGERSDGLTITPQRKESCEPQSRLTGYGQAAEGVRVGILDSDFLMTLSSKEHISALQRVLFREYFKPGYFKL